MMPDHRHDERDEEVATLRFLNRLLMSVVILMAIGCACIVYAFTTLNQGVQ